jgi:hypothetical protein
MAKELGINVPATIAADARYGVCLGPTMLTIASYVYQGRQNVPMSKTLPKREEGSLHQVREIRIIINRIRGISNLIPSAYLGHL